MIGRRIPPCYDCGAWDDEREGCTMPSLDRLYACPLEDEEKREERMLKLLADFVKTVIEAVEKAVEQYRAQGYTYEEIKRMLTEPDEGEED